MIRSLILTSSSSFHADLWLAIDPFRLVLVTQTAGYNNNDVMALILLSLFQRLIENWLKVYSR